MLGEIEGGLVIPLNSRTRRYLIEWVLARDVARGPLACTAGRAFSVFKTFF